MTAATDFQPALLRSATPLGATPAEIDALIRTGLAAQAAARPRDALRPLELALMAVPADQAMPVAEVLATLYAQLGRAAPLHQLFARAPADLPLTPTLAVMLLALLRTRRRVAGHRDAEDADTDADHTDAAPHATADAALQSRAALACEPLALALRDNRLNPGELELLAGVAFQLGLDELAFDALVGLFSQGHWTAGRLAKALVIAHDLGRLDLAEQLLDAALAAPDDARLPVAGYALALGLDHVATRAQAAPARSAAPRPDKVARFLAARRA